MQLCHRPAALSPVFNEPNLIVCTGLVPAGAPADRNGPRDLADEWLTVPGSSGTVPTRTSHQRGGWVKGLAGPDGAMSAGGAGGVPGSAGEPLTNRCPPE